MFFSLKVAFVGLEYLGKLQLFIFGDVLLFCLIEGYQS